MNDISINNFLQELSSLSPLTGEYESNILVLAIYMSLLKKNTELTIMRVNDEELIEFKKILNENISNLYKTYDFSNKSINNYMLLMKMPKSTKEQINQYNQSFDELNIEKINQYINLISNIYNIEEFYNKCKNLFKKDYIDANNLCISNLNNIKYYLINLVKSLCSEIEDEKTAFDFLSKVKKF